MPQRHRYDISRGGADIHGGGYVLPKYKISKSCGKGPPVEEMLQQNVLHRRRNVFLDGPFMAIARVFDA